MNLTRFVRLSLRPLLIAFAAALFLWRCAIDWSHMMPREIRDAAQTSLLIVLLAVFAPVGVVREPPVARPSAWTSRTVLAVVIGTALGIIFIFNGYLAWKRLACRDVLIAEAAAAGIPVPAERVSKCFEGSASE